MKCTSLIVAVHMITYNHAKYITQAVEGVMMQQLEGEFKLFLADDCSTDGTTEICIELKSKYPDKIELCTSEKNLGAIPNTVRVFGICGESGAPYIAICEGDDYWTDPLKLQKQVDLMEKNSDLSLTFTNATKLIDGSFHPFYIHDQPPEHKLDLKAYLDNRFPIPTASALMKAEVAKQFADIFTKTKRQIFHADYLLWCVCAQSGNLLFLNQETMVYRQHGTSILRTTPSRVMVLRGLDLDQLLAELLGTEHEHRFLNGNWWNYLELSFIDIEEGNWFSSIAYLCQSLWSATTRGQKRQWNILKDYLFRVKKKFKKS